jgi:hypothetical protein
MDKTDLFPETAVARIHLCKELIETHFKHMILQPWFDGGLAVDWKTFYLSGGAIASLIQGEIPKDWDIYCESALNMKMVEEMVKKNPDYIADVRENYVGVFGSNGKMVTANAITMKDGTSFITKLYLPPSEMKKTFDFVHCKPHYNLTTKTLYISPQQYIAIVNKNLIRNNGVIPQTWREEKFKKKGYKYVNT